MRYVNEVRTGSGSERTLRKRRSLGKRVARKASGTPRGFCMDVQIKELPEKGFLRP
jgi:hypothetical protein